MLGSNGRQPLRCQHAGSGGPARSPSCHHYVRTLQNQGRISSRAHPAGSSPPLSARFQVQIDQDTTKFKSISFQDQPVLSSQLPTQGAREAQASYLRLGPNRRWTDGGCQTKTTMQGQRYFSSPANNHSHAILYTTRILFNS
jgi:hypothetical protein